VIDTKIKPFVTDKIKASLGDPDEDLVDFVLENIRDRKRPEDIIDGLEPVSYIVPFWDVQLTYQVLDEEAVPLTIQLWRLLAFESAAHRAGLESGTMMV
jgi:RNA-binding protein 25